MAVYRVDVLCDDPEPVLNWINENVPKNYVVRAVAYSSVRGWHVKAVFKRPADAESFHRRWFPSAVDHAVAPFTTPA